MLYVLPLAMLATAQINVFTPADLEKGEEVDTLRYLISYDFSFVNDTTRKPYNTIKERMQLEIGGRMTSFYSYEAFRADSANAVIMANGGNRFSAGGKVSWRMYKNYPTEGSYSWLEKFGLDRFVCTEQLVEPIWQPCPDSSAVILGYPCSMAKANFKGREWHVWYAEDMPISEGPWLLCGLPGLILKAYDSQNQFLFEACGMREGNDTEAIYYKGAKYEAVDRKALLSLYRRYYADPVGYITNNPKVTVHVRDEHGNDVAPEKGVPYNLLDREK